MLESFTTEELLPATIPAIEDETLLEQVSMQLQTSFSRLNEISEQNNDTLKNLSAIQQAFLQIVEQIRASIRHSTPSDLQGILSEMAKVNTSILAMTQKLPETLQGIQQDSQNAVEAVANLIQKNQAQLERYTRARPILIPLPTISQWVLMFCGLVALIIAGHALWSFANTLLN